jgi:hypothetical protein
MTTTTFRTFGITGKTKNNFFTGGFFLRAFCWGLFEKSPQTPKTSAADANVIKEKHEMLTSEKLLYRAWLKMFLKNPQTPKTSAADANVIK